MKRLFDITAVLLTAALWLPLMAVISLAVWAGLGGSVFFVQERPGLGGRPFRLIKFRTMREGGGTDAQRLTRLGRWLRSTSLDELPEFWNVLKGEMSLVGPRPHMLAHTEYYSELINEYMVRHYVRPGITGLAQVSGCRGETKTVEEMRERVEKDIEYIENWSFWRDIVIIMQTFVMALKGDKQAY